MSDLVARARAALDSAAADSVMGRGHSRLAELVPELVDEIEQLQQWHSNQADKLERVLALAEKWRYKGEFGWGAWQEGHGPDETGWALDGAASEIRAALGVSGLQREPL